MKEIRSFEKLVTLYPSSRCKSPEDIRLQPFVCYKFSAVIYFVSVTNTKISQLLLCILNKGGCFFLLDISRTCNSYLTSKGDFPNFDL